MDTLNVKRRKKVCTQCGRKLWLRDFYQSSRGRISSVCKECTRKQKREQYNKNRKVEDGIFFHPVKGRIVEHKGTSTRIFWSPSMIAYLRRHYSTTKNEELAEELGISSRTIIRKARELNLWKDKDWLSGIWDEHRIMARAESKRKGYPGAFKPGCTAGKKYWFKRKHGNTSDTSIKQGA